MNTDKAPHTGAKCSYQCASVCDHLDCQHCLEIKQASQRQASQPFVKITFDGPDSVKSHIEVTSLSPMQLWAVAAWIERYADQLYAREQMEAQRAAMEAMREKAEVVKVAKSLKVVRD